MKAGAFTIVAKADDTGLRLDTVVSRHVEDLTRSAAGNLIRQACIRVGGRPVKPGYRLKAGDTITGEIPPPREPDCQPEPIDIRILHEDAHIIVIDKQAGLVVHPAPGNFSGTLVNALLHHCPDLRGIGNVLRPGIVHRLDKDTTGALVVAKTDRAHGHLSAQFKARTVRKTYLALVDGSPPAAAGIIDAPIGRHPADRKRMSTLGHSGRRAETHWRVAERLPAAALLEVDIKTGRTHQIRVHCAAQGHPVVGDSVYGRRRAQAHPSVRRDREACELMASARRQMLHAWMLSFTHPVTAESMTFRAPIPDDMAQLLEKLRTLKSSAA